MTTRRLASIVLVILSGIAAGFFFRDVGLGRTLGVAVALWLVLSVACRPPLTPLVSASRADGRRYLLAVVCPVADAAAAAARIEAAWAGREHPQDTVVRLVVPIQSRFLDRWASAVDRPRTEARRKLRAITTSLADSGIPAEESVGDEDVVQAVEDEICQFPATEVVLLTGIGEEPAKVRRTSDELRSRLVAYFRHIHVEDDPTERRPAQGTDHPAYRPPPTLQPQ
jgi:hypothetical protein